MSEPPVTAPAPVPPPPGPPPYGVGVLFTLRPGTRRWPVAVRTSLCMGVPVLVGWAAGDVAAGLMATIGAFTALYGRGKPYLYRGVQLALIAAALALAVSLGIAAAAVTWLGVVVVAVIAALATLVAGALPVGPPGAYMIALACAAGISMHAEHLDPLRTGLLVLAGGVLSWLVHMAGALIRPRGPERAAVASAGTAVARYADAVGTEREDDARHRAATALHESWAVLVTEQPVDPRPDSTLSRLRALTRELHLLFAQAAGGTIPPGAADRARQLGRLAGDPPPVTPDPGDAGVPLGRPGAWASLRDAVRPESVHLRVAAGVAAASLLAGAAGAALGVERAYWAMTAAVLMLHQGFDWVRTLQRGLERLAGTWLGLVVAAAVLALHPQGPWLALTLMVLQFGVEMTVLRNYALAVVFITPMALTIAAGGRPVAGLGGLLLARGVDTAIGCAVAIAVYAVTARRAAATRMSEAMGRTVEAVRVTVGQLATGAVTSPAARAARRDLQHRTLALADAYDVCIGGSPRLRRTAERSWPAVVAIQRLAYRTLSVCWALEHLGGDAAGQAARSLFGPDGEARAQTALDGLARAVRDGTAPADGPGPPGFLADEVRAVRGSLVSDPA